MFEWHKDWEGRNKAITDLRWHDCISRKIERIYGKPVELTKEFRNFAGCKINVQSKVVVLNNSNSSLDMKIKIKISHQVPRIMSIKRWGGEHGHHGENYSILLKNIKEGINDWRVQPYS